MFEMRDPNLEADDAMFLRQFAAMYNLQAGFQDSMAGRVSNEAYARRFLAIAEKLRGGESGAVQPPAPPPTTPETPDVG